MQLRFLILLCVPPNFQDYCCVHFAWFQKYILISKIIINMVMFAYFKIILPFFLFPEAKSLSLCGPGWQSFCFQPFLLQIYFYFICLLNAGIQVNTTMPVSCIQICRNGGGIQFSYKITKSKNVKRLSCKNVSRLQTLKCIMKMGYG